MKKIFILIKSFLIKTILFIIAVGILVFVSTYLFSCPLGTIELKGKHITACYDTMNNVSAYSYAIVNNKTKTKNVDRKDDFRADTRLPDDIEKVNQYYYRGSGYDRGHLVPSADFLYSREANSETFIMSNIAPQLPSHNRKIWRNLEGYVRKKIQNGEKIVVYTGTDLNDDSGFLKKIKIPSAFWKIIVYEDGEKEGYYIPQEYIGNDFRDYKAPVSYIEKEIGHLIYISRN